MSPSSDRLVSEKVEPVSGSFDAASMAAGIPGLPLAFRWRGREYRVAEILETRKSFRDCHSGSGERYVDKHYYTVRAESGETMTLYRARTGSKADEWVLYTVSGAGKTPVRVAVLVSGGGTNLQALIDAEAAAREAGGATYEIVLVVADRDGTYAIERARKAGIPAELALPPKGVPRPEARRAVSDRVLELARAQGAEAIVLAGFLTIMSGPVIEEYSGRILNLHPALLPKFGGPGMWGHHVHEAVLASRDAESGCTVHLVDAGCDTGPILLQRRVPILPGDTPDSLAERIHAEEHLAIVEGTKLLAARLRP
jgi:phosphoribosylglycinamide formyltransferase-1